MRARGWLIALAVVVVLALGAWIIVPRVVRSQMDHAFATIFTRPPSVGRIAFNPLTLTLTIEKFRLPATGDAIASFERLRIGFDLLSPFRGAPTFRMVELDHPEGHLALAPNGTLNAAGLFKPQPVPVKPAEPPSLRFLRIALTRGMVEWRDSTRTPVLVKTVDSLAIVLNDFRTQKTANNRYHLAAETPQGEFLDWGGTFTLAPFTSAGHVRLDRLRARNIDEWVAGILPFRLARGEINVRTHYVVDAGKTPAAFALDSLEVALHDFALADRGADTALVVVTRASARGGTMDPAKMHVNLGDVNADGVRVLCWLQDDGHLNLEKWGQPVPGAPVDTAGPWTVTADSMSARALDLTLEDRRLPRPARIRIVSGTFALRGMTTAPNVPFPAVFACSTGAGGVARGEGTLALTPPVGDLAVNVDGYDLRVLQPYIDVFAGLDLVRGAVDAKGRMRFQADTTKGPLMTFAGEVNAHDLLTRDRDLRQDFVSWKRLKLIGLAATVMPTKITIKDIEAVGPYVRAVVAPDRTTNLQKVLTPPGPPPAAFTAASTDTPEVRIDRIRVKDGSAYFSDQTLRPGFTTGMQGLSGSITGLSSVRQTGGEIELAGQVDRYAPVSITGRVDPLGGAGSSDIHLNFKNLELTTFTPYSGKFMGYPIRKGKLNLDLRYQVAGKKLTGENKVFIEQLSLGEKVDSPDATHLPVRFAIALLKDKHGNIDLDVPVHGDLDDPKFSIGRVILKVLLNLIVKAVSSPFHLLGALVGGGEKADLEGVEFDPGQSALDPAALSVLDQLSKALTERPALRLEIEQAPDAARDSSALVLAGYQKLLAESMTPQETQAVAASTPLTPEQRAALIERTYVKRFGPLPKTKAGAKPKKGAAADSAAAAAAAIRLAGMEQQLRQTITVVPGEFTALARERALAIKEQLLKNGVPEERLFVVTSAAPSWKAPAGEGVDADSTEAGAAPADSVEARPAADPSRVRVRLALTGE